MYHIYYLLFFGIFFGENKIVILVIWLKVSDFYPRILATII